MPSTLGKYNLLKTLGSGANSKVKLGQDKENGRFFAIKILKKNNPNNDAKFLELVMTEVHTMSQLSHSNIVNLIEYNKEAIVEKANGAKEAVIYIALELATGGELFDYVATTGKFNENISRFYFQQLLSGLEYVHQQGVTHRDLKPENVLFDQYFNLKIADFGFAAPIAGKDGSGTCKTKLGTESYMAPEIHARKPYIGASVDLFACAIILFIMSTQHPPFTKAEPSDPFYRLICANRADLFWKAHSKNKPEGFFTEDFKSLITSMLQFDPTHRLSMAEVKAHPWVNGPVSTLEEINAEFLLRKNTIDLEAESKRQQKIAEKAQKVGGFAMGRRQYRGVHRGDAEETKESEYDIDEEVIAIEPFFSAVKKNTDLFSTHDPESLFDEIINYFDIKGFKYDVAKGRYKTKLQIIPVKGEPIEMTIKVLKAEDEKFVIDFQRTSGDQIQFFEQFNDIKEFMGNFINATA